MLTATRRDSCSRAALLLGACALVLFGGARTALAQPYYNGWGGGYYGWGGGYHASTAGEGYARGMADVVRSQGMANLANSRAAINLEAAQSAAIDNRLKATQAYWDRKKIYDKNMAEKRYADAQVRREHRARVVLRPIGPDELNPTTGEIDWPALLKQPQYDEFREPLTKLFETRGQYGELSSNDYLEAKQLIKDFRAAVTANKASYPEAPLRSALRFLLKLDRELDSNFS